MFSDHNIFGFEISMCDSKRMKILNSVDELLEVNTGHLLWQSWIWTVDYEIIKLASFNIFHDKVQFLIGLNDLKELNYVGMSDFLYYSHLAWYVCFISVVNNNAFIDDFDCYFLLGYDVGAEADFSEGAFSDAST